MPPGDVLGSEFTCEQTGARPGRGNAVLGEQTLPRPGLSQSLASNPARNLTGRTSQNLHTGVKEHIVFDQAH